MFCLFLAAVGLALSLSRGPSGASTALQPPIPPPHVWRSMRQVWEFKPGTPDDDEGIEDLFSIPGRFYYVSEHEIGCLEKSSGKLLWHHRLASPKAAESQNRQVWNLVADGRFVYVYESSIYPGKSTQLHHLYAVNAQTGASVWDSTSWSGFDCPPCSAGSLLLFADGDGFITAMRRNTGTIVWQCKLTSTTYQESPPLALHAANGIVVAQIGEHLIGLRLSDGSRLWDRMPEGYADENVQYRQSVDFALDAGIVYSCVGGHLEALQVGTGKPVWRRRAYFYNYGNSPPILVAGNTLLVYFPDTLAALNRFTGATVWLSALELDSSDKQSSIMVSTENTAKTILAVSDYAPALSDARGAFRSVQQFDTVIALDPVTGHETWRWQPEKGTDFDKVFSEAGRLFLTDKESVLAFEEGRPDPLPTGPDERRQLVRRMMNARFDWPDTPHLGDGTTLTEADLVLLRLGRDSVPLLREYIHHLVDEGNAQAPATGIPSSRGRNGGMILDGAGSTDDALDLLFDLDDPATPQILAAELDRAKDPSQRGAIVETLIRWGRPQGLPALFRYATTGSEVDERRPDALYCVCRRVDVETAAGHAVSPGRAEITAYLITAVSDPKSPTWLRNFAKFELLNHRGEAAARAALATFKQERTASLLPANLTLKSLAGNGGANTGKGFPTEFRPDSLCRDDAGTWWAAFRCDYPGPVSSGWGYVWFAQSQDGKNWTRPAFGFDLRSQCAQYGWAGEFTLTLRQNRLCLDWTEQVYTDHFPPVLLKQIPHRSEVTIEDLYRDSDHDGLTDRLETLIGTDPNRADTNGNGIPDNEDKNPTYRPHTLTEEEAIYQAVIEALCQYGRQLAEEKSSDPNKIKLSLPFGGSARPLTLPAPPGSTGVEILGHSGPVLFKPYSPDQSFAAGELAAGRFGSFKSPYIDLEGQWLGPEDMRESFSDRPVDPFRPSPEESGTPGSFRQWFPYTLSADRTRARVGWLWSDHFPTGPISGQIGFDIEVNKIGGQWLPVECRVVSWSSSSNAVLPISR